MRNKLMIAAAAVAIASTIIGAAPARADDNSLLAAMGRDGIPGGANLIPLAHQTCDTFTGNRLGLFGLNGQLAAQGLDPRQIFVFMQHAIAAYCPGAA